MNNKLQEFIKLLKELPNAEGSFNCQCFSGDMIEGGKAFTCDFCINLNKLVEEKFK